jgi:hypothetical protein
MMIIIMEEARGEKVKRVEQVSQGDVAYSILNYEWKIETCVPEKKVRIVQ